jgi:hypothetical protein
MSADVPGNPHSAHYIATKRDKLGHLSNTTAGVFIAGNRSARGASMLEAGSTAVGSGAATLNLAPIPNS